MSDIIHLLPDSVANQIAAGEVVQRPASVVKELIENALDAGATEIQVLIKACGKNLVQVVDNGKGMSETDARMSFERHATSKIKSANDLFALRTMGFRGEALASIAAVAQVELRSKRAEDELGTLIEIAGSKIERQESISCGNGSSFSVKNIFFNVPARRKFLKSDSTELMHICNEFIRVALVRPDIAFSFIHNDDTLYQLPESNLRQRIVNVFGKQLNAQLLPVEVDTSLAKITGYVGKPESARKHSNHQFFFVNGRYMRHPYFHKAVIQAFERMLPADVVPAYFIHFEVKPENIDVNIHPTKTEIKFENEREIWTILRAAVRETLGKFNIVPSIDFDREGAPDIPVYKPSAAIVAPRVEINSHYNPFKPETSAGGNTLPPPEKKAFDWEKLYQGFESESEQKNPTLPSMEFESSISSNETKKADSICDFLQLKNKYILTSVKSGLMIIDQHRAHIRVLFEQYLRNINQQKIVSQPLLFPDAIELTTEEGIILQEMLSDLHYAGFMLEISDGNTCLVNAVPPAVEGRDCAAVLKEMIADRHENTGDSLAEIHEKMALTLARAAAIPAGKMLSAEEMSHLVNELFACDNHAYLPDGKRIMRVVTEEEIGL